MKVLMMTIALMMTSLFACARNSPEKELTEERMEANEEYQEEVGDAKEKLDDSSHDTKKERMEDRKDFEEDVNDASEERQEEINEAREDYLEDKID